MNLQDGNVGNAGDILKHAALQALAQGLGAGTGPLHYLDTHAYRLRAPLAGHGWPQEVAARQARWPAYGAYRALQADAVAGGEYLCSVAIAAGQLPGAALWLSESEAGTRRTLIRQLSAAGLLSRTTLRAGVLDWCGAPVPDAPGRLLALVDPFRLEAADWRGAVCALRRLHRAGEDGALLLFDSGSAAPVGWPPPPPGWQGPVRRIAEGEYRLAVYLAGPRQPALAARLDALGWEGGAVAERSPEP